ncbi:hypothetical protein VDGD_20278 [Verticillium dahliae]|nr:hypothetical protein VDGD_20278 [Verticillium dahliae]
MSAGPHKTYATARSVTKDSTHPENVGRARPHQRPLPPMPMRMPVNEQAPKPPVILARRGEIPHGPRRILHGPVERRPRRAAQLRPEHVRRRRGPQEPAVVDEQRAQNLEILVEPPVEPLAAERGARVEAGVEVRARVGAGRAGGEVAHAQRPEGAVVEDAGLAEGEGREAEGREDVAVEVGLQGGACEGLEDAAGPVDGAAVAEALARLEEEREGEALVDVGAGQGRDLVEGLPALDVRREKVVRCAGRVREEEAEGDWIRAGCKDRLRFSVGRWEAREDLLRSEDGDVGGHVFVEGHDPALHELEDANRGDELCGRREPQRA